MSNNAKCPHCGAVFFKGAPLQEIIEIRVLCGKKYLFCPTCGKEISISEFIGGKYDVEYEVEPEGLKTVYDYGDVVKQVRSMSASWKCPHCGEVFFKGEKLLELAGRRIASGTEHLICPICLGKINIGMLASGKYDEDNAQIVKPEKITTRYNSNHILSSINQAIINNLDVSASKVRPETKIVEDLDADDYDLIGLIMRLEYDFGIEFADEDIDLDRKKEELTVARLVELVIKKLSALTVEFREPTRNI